MGTAPFETLSSTTATTSPVVQRQQLIVTLFGLYGRKFNGLLPIANIIELMTDVGLEAADVRSVISRLKRRGVLSSGKINGQAAYQLSPDLEQVFAEGDERIFHPARAKVDDPWLLVSFTVPESKRNLRHKLRSLLTRLGFGVITSGLWVGPALSEQALLQDLERQDLRGFTTLFRSTMIGEEDMAYNVSQWWDLPELASQLNEFIDHYSQEDPHQKPLARYLHLVTDWRRLPYTDPGLPLEYLPADWPGPTAQKLFLELHEKLSGPALQRATQVLGSED